MQLGRYIMLIPYVVLPLFSSWWILCKTHLWPEKGGLRLQILWGHIMKGKIKQTQFGGEEKKQQLYIDRHNCLQITGLSSKKSPKPCLNYKICCHNRQQIQALSPSTCLCAITKSKQFAQIKRCFNDNGLLKGTFFRVRREWLLNTNKSKWAP